MKIKNILGVTCLFFLFSCNEVIVNEERKESSISEDVIEIKDSLLGEKIDNKLPKENLEIGNSYSTFALIDNYKFKINEAFEFIDRPDFEPKFKDNLEFAWHCQSPENEETETFIYEGFKLHVNTLLEIAWLYQADLTLPNISIYIDGFVLNSETKAENLLERFKSIIGKEESEEIYRLEIYDNYTLYIEFSNGRPLQFFNKRHDCEQGYWLPIKAGDDPY